MKNYVVVGKTTEMNHQQWLDMRKNSVGGSEIAAALGLSRWRSPFDVWAEKTGHVTKKDEPTDAMRFGTLLEPVIRKEFARRNGLEVCECPYILAHKDYPFMTCNLDGYVKLPDGSCAVLEIKTANTFASDEWSNMCAPLEYIMQVQYYLAISQMRFAYLAVLIGSSDYRQVIIERDDEVIAVIIEKLKEFWRMVETNTPPPVRGMDNNLLASLYPCSRPNVIALGKEHEALFTQYEEAKKAMDEAKKLKEDAEAKLKMLLMDNEVATCNGYRISWKTSSRTTFSSDKAKVLLNMEQIKSCMVESSVRTFRITKVKPKADATKKKISN